MTGFGEASFHSETLSLAIEVRALNNRYLKVLLRATEPFNLLEPEFEKVVRRTIHRGTVQIHMRCQRQFAPQEYKINTVALRCYLNQLRALQDELDLGQDCRPMLAQVLILPGVVPEPGQFSLELAEEWPVIERVFEEALARLQTMRQQEGQAMAQDLRAQHEHLVAILERIRGRVPQVALAFRERLLERVRDLLEDMGVRIEPSDLIKEVSIFAERSDIAEEVVRLGSHLDQFLVILDEPESSGRKLEFLTQEMFREANTIGSKGSDVEISRQVVEIKGALEKIRELVQNVE
jgi:uncharacterized protein (TIGR00255 family)